MWILLSVLPMLWAEALPGARSGMGTKGAAPAGAGGSIPRVIPAREAASQQLRVPTPCRSPSGLVASFPSRRQRPQSPLVSLIRASQGSVFLPPGVQGLRAVAACGSRSLPSPPRAPRCRPASPWLCAARSQLPGGGRAGLGALPEAGGGLCPPRPRGALCVLAPSCGLSAASARSWAPPARSGFAPHFVPGAAPPCSAAR